MFAFGKVKLEVKSAVVLHVFNPEVKGLFL